MQIFESAEKEKLSKEKKEQYNVPQAKNNKTCNANVWQRNQIYYINMNPEKKRNILKTKHSNITVWSQRKNSSS